MTTMPTPQNLETTDAPYTARNRDRGPNYGRAEKYLDPSTASNSVLERSLRESLRRAQATRVANRAHYEARRRELDLPNEDGYSRIRWLLHGIRDAESIDMMVHRDRMLDGIIVGASLFGGITPKDAQQLQTLRYNALDYRRGELQLRYSAMLP